MAQAVSSTLSDVLQDIVNRAIVRWTELKSRILRAATLVTDGAVISVGSGEFEVRSQTDGPRRYHVDSAGCVCPDVAWAPGGRCKHLIATRLVRWRDKHQQAARANHLTSEMVGVR